MADEHDATLHIFLTNKQKRSKLGGAFISPSVLDITEHPFSCAEFCFMCSFPFLNCNYFLDLQAIMIVN